MPVNDKLCLGKIDKKTAMFHPLQMAKKRMRKLYIREWADRLGRKQVEVAKAAGVGQSFMSLVFKGEKPGMSVEALLGISELFGLSVNDLFRPPPERDVTERFAQLRPDQVAALGDLLDAMKKPRR